jgi:hypothetical protein
MAIIIILTTLTRQRLSVPELSMQKMKNSLVLFFGLISISSLFFTFILNDLSMKISRKIGFVDNIFIITFMLSSFIFCFFSYDLLQKLSFKENSRIINYLYFKKVLLISMFTQAAFYITSFFLISFYHPVIFTEKILLSSMILTINLNSIAFYFMFVIFIYTMKYDLYYVNLQLVVIPELEFFLDAEEELLKNQIEKMI